MMIRILTAVFVTFCLSLAACGSGDDTSIQEYELEGWVVGQGDFVILYDEWTPAQVKAFRLMVNKSVSREDWLKSRLGTYHLNFAHHSGKYIRLDHADQLD